MTKNLTIVGFGIKVPVQLTLEGVAAIRDADRVLYFGAPPEVMVPVLAQLGARSVIDIQHLYRDGAIDADNYARMVAFVHEALSEVDRVALLVYGHPRLGVTITGVLEEAQGPALDVQVIPGPSSFDTMLNDLRRDPLERGSLMIDVNRLLLFKIALDSAVDHYLYHMGSIGTRRVHVSDPRRDNHLALLRVHLLRFFAADHPAELICSPSAPGAPVYRRSATVGTLERLLSDMRFDATLFLPAAKPKRLDRRFLGLLQGAEENMHEQAASR